MLLAVATCAMAILVHRADRRGLACACLLGCVPAFLVWPGPSVQERFRLLAVGHGQAALLETAAGERVLIDCGSMMDGRRAGRAVARASRRGDRRLDLLILTHADVDHWGGTAELCQSVPITRAVLAEGLRHTPVPDTLREAGVPYRFLLPGARELLAEGLLAVAPTVTESTSDNEQSLWVRYDGGFSILLPADAEGRALLALIEDPISRSVDVLVLPHHGRIEPALRSRLEDRARAERVLVSTAGAGEQEITIESLHRGTFALRPKAPR